MLHVYFLNVHFAFKSTHHFMKPMPSVVCWKDSVFLIVSKNSEVSTIFVIKSEERWEYLTVSNKLIKSLSFINFELESELLLQLWSQKLIQEKTLSSLSTHKSSVFSNLMSWKQSIFGIARSSWLPSSSTSSLGLSLIASWAC